MGGMTPYPVRSVLKYFAEDFASPEADANEQGHSTGRSRHTRAATDRNRQVEIDGLPATVKAGTSILRAARESGVDIPKLCATDSLKPFGSCRMCLVEVEGRKGYPASCTTPVEDGMKIRTQTDCAGLAAPQCHGAVYLRSSAGLPDLFRERRLRIAGHGRGQVGLRDVRYGFDGENHLDAPVDAATRIFQFDAASASSARAACAPATRSRALSH